MDARRCKMKLNGSLILILSLFTVVKSNLTISTAGIIFSQDNSIIFSGPGTDKVTLHLGMAMPKIKIDEKISCLSEAPEESNHALELLSEKVKVWILDLMERNLDRNISTDFLNEMVDENKKDIIARSRRSFKYLSDGYFLLSSWTENELEKNYHYTDNLFQRIKGSLNQMRFKISESNENIKTLTSFICRENRKISLWEAMTNIKLSFLDFIKSVSQQVELAQIGTVPSTVKYDVLKDSCLRTIRQNVESKICDLINLRTFFITTFKKLLLDQNKSSLILEIELNIPKPQILNLMFTEFIKFQFSVTKPFYN